MPKDSDNISNSTTYGSAVECWILTIAKIQERKFETMLAKVREGLDSLTTILDKMPGAMYEALDWKTSEEDFEELLHYFYPRECSSDETAKEDEGAESSAPNTPAHKDRGRASTDSSALTSTLDSTSSGGPAHPPCVPYRFSLTDVERSPGRGASHRSCAGALSPNQQRGPPHQGRWGPQIGARHSL